MQASQAPAVSPETMIFVAVVLLLIGIFFILAQRSHASHAAVSREHLLELSREADDFVAVQRLEKGLKAP